MTAHLPQCLVVTKNVTNKNIQQANPPQPKSTLKNARLWDWEFPSEDALFLAIDARTIASRLPSTGITIPPMVGDANAIAGNGVTRCLMISPVKLRIRMESGLGNTKVRPDLVRRPATSGKRRGSADAVTFRSDSVQRCLRLQDRLLKN